MQKTDLRQRTFGLLTALEACAQRSPGGSVLWRCRCACGAETLVSEYSLVSGNTKSCGCLKRQAMQAVRARQTFADGTCVEFLSRRTHRCDNTSGFRGVVRVGAHKWRVQIGFQGIRRHIGYYGDYREAVQARLTAEEQLYRPFLQRVCQQAPEG